MLWLCCKSLKPQVSVLVGGQSLDLSGGGADPISLSAEQGTIPVGLFAADVNATVVTLEILCESTSRAFLDVADVGSLVPLDVLSHDQQVADPDRVDAAGLAEHVAGAEAADLDRLAVPLRADLPQLRGLLAGLLGLLAQQVGLGVRQPVDSAVAGVPTGSPPISVLVVATSGGSCRTDASVRCHGLIGPAAWLSWAT